MWRCRSAPAARPRNDTPVPDARIVEQWEKQALHRRRTLLQTGFVYSCIVLRRAAHPQTLGGGEAVLHQVVVLGIVAPLLQLGSRQGQKAFQQQSEEGQRSAIERDRDGHGWGSGLGLGTLDAIWSDEGM